eukprot:4405729-Pyramimonas_sp.AAC.1
MAFSRASGRLPRGRGRLLRARKISDLRPRTARGPDSRTTSGNLARNWVRANVLELRWTLDKAFHLPRRLTCSSDARPRAMSSLGPEWRIPRGGGAHGMPSARQT